MMTFESANDMVRSRLSEERYRHSLAVSDCAKQLALRYGADAEKAAFAGLVHDVCKDDTREKLLQTAAEFGIIFTESETQSPKIWHAIVGAALVGRFFSDDPEIIGAVRYHTTGRGGMTLLEKIVYVADCISDDRTYPDVVVLRETAFRSLDAVIFEMTRRTLVKLVGEGKLLHPDTIEAYNETCPRSTGPKPARAAGT